MRKYAETSMKIEGAKPSPNGWDVLAFPSLSGSDKVYTIDLTHGRCSCPAWIYQKGGERKPCKHLKALGFKQIMPEFAEYKEAKPIFGGKVTIKVKH